MNTVLSSLYVDPVELEGWQRLLLLLPLCLAIAVVYKTTKCDRLRDVPLASVVLWITIVIGMYVVGVGLFVIYELMA